VKLSENFSLAELTRSQVATRKNIPNDPSWIEVSNLKSLCKNILEPVRFHFDRPFSPASGYRSLVLNNEIGSHDKSQHILGQAADLEIYGVSNYDLAVWIRDNLDFDQLILEHHDRDIPSSGWVHVSYLGNNRKEVLEFRDHSWSLDLKN